MNTFSKTAIIYENTYNLDEEGEELVQMQSYRAYINFPEKRVLNKNPSLGVFELPIDAEIVLQDKISINAFECWVIEVDSIRYRIASAQNHPFLGYTILKCVESRKFE